MTLPVIELGMRVCLAMESERTARSVATVAA